MAKFYLNAGCRKKKKITLCIHWEISFVIKIQVVISVTADETLKLFRSFLKILVFKIFSEDLTNEQTKGELLSCCSSSIFLIEKKYIFLNLLDWYPLGINYRSVKLVHQNVFTFFTTCAHISKCTPESFLPIFYGRKTLSFWFRKKWGMSLRGEGGLKQKLYISGLHSINIM